MRDLGRGEDALAAVDEAVSIRRKLTDEYPAAFLPDFVASLGNQCKVLRWLGRREAALTAIDEAVRRALPALERSHSFLSDAGVGLVGDYLRCCQDADREPDAEMIARVQAVQLVADRVIADDQPPR